MAVNIEENPEAIVGRWGMPTCRGPIVVPMAWDRCTICDQVVALMAWDTYYASRIDGDSRYGYEPTHVACSERVAWSNKLASFLPRPLIGASS